MTSENVPEHIKQADSRLRHITTVNEKWEAAGEQLAQDWASLRLLIEYYESQWGEDMERFPRAPYGVLSEDGVWNEMGRFYEALKEIRDVSTRIVHEYEGEETENA
ncbi:DUF4298 domain-containing protein [Corynebacterium tuscaniense]|uniref:DUF4298 domain-containing protein n=1 Tax=Corynebacterium tuscaniense TaxID=302449 RepID=A0A2N6T824_9CORY|nr:DUF4298 domain-containing protein [Corynebacterium tuscaniense]PMC65465.1 DUF4298 domain-containing protein [Corynebacterium tuscaniense]